MLGYAITWNVAITCYNQHCPLWCLLVLRDATWVSLDTDWTLATPWQRVSPDLPRKTRRSQNWWLVSLTWGLFKTYSILYTTLFRRTIHWPVFCCSEEVLKDFEGFSFHFKGASGFFLTHSHMKVSWNCDEVTQKFWRSSALGGWLGHPKSDKQP